MSGPSALWDMFEIFLQNRQISFKEYDEEKLYKSISLVITDSQTVMIVSLKRERARKRNESSGEVL